LSSSFHVDYCFGSSKTSTVYVTVASPGTFFVALPSTPKANFGGMVIRRLPPTFIPLIPKCQPFMPSSLPNLYWKPPPLNCLSKTVLSANCPAYKMCNTCPFLISAPLPIFRSFMSIPFGNFFSINFFSCCFCCLFGFSFASPALSSAPLVPFFVGLSFVFSPSLDGVVVSVCSLVCGFALSFCASVCCGFSGWLSTFGAVSSFATSAFGASCGLFSSVCLPFCCCCCFLNFFSLGFGKFGRIRLVIFIFSISCSGWFWYFIWIL